jgi:hypothetical protein
MPELDTVVTHSTEQNGVMWLTLDSPAAEPMFQLAMRNIP